MKPLRLAVAGAGLIGQAHIRVLQDRARSHGDVVLSMVVDPSPAAAVLAHQMGAQHLHTLDALLSSDAPDGVVLATPNALHFEQAMQCVDAGIPILLEKPVTATVAEGIALLDHVQAKDAKVLVGHHRAHSPIMARACEIVRSGVLGRLVGVMGSATFLKPADYFEQAPWRARAGAGPILLNMIHEVHNLRMLCGEITAVQAFASHAIRGLEVEDTVAISLTFAHGVLGSFLLSDTAACPRSWEQTSQENPAYPSYPDEDCYVLTGTHGSLSIPSMRLKTYPDEAGRSWFKPFVADIVDVVRDDPLKHQMAHFLAMIRGHAEPKVSVADGLANLRVTEALVEAARLGATVTL